MRITQSLVASVACLGLIVPTAAAQSGTAASNPGDLIYVSGIVHTPPGPAADFATQIDGILTTIATRLKGVGSGLDRVVATTVYLKSASDFPTLNAAWTKTWPNDPPTRTTVVASLPSPDALLQVSAVAIPAGAERTVVHPAGWARPAGPYSYAIRTGDTVFLSGLIPRNGRDNSVVAGDIGIQTSAVLGNARAILTAAGLGLANVVSARVYLTDTAGFQAMNSTYRPSFPVDPPARATVRSSLVHPNDLIEITLTATAGGARKPLVTPAADGRPGQPNPNLSSAIETGSRLYLSGMLGVLPGNVADLASQTEETLNRLERTMTLAGYSWSNVREAVVYVTDITKAEGVRAALQRRTAGFDPQVSVVGAGLMSPDGLVEIMLTAAK